MDVLMKYLYAAHFPSAHREDGKANMMVQQLQGHGEHLLRLRQRKRPTNAHAYQHAAANGLQPGRGASGGGRVHGRRDECVAELA